MFKFLQKLFNSKPKSEEERLQERYEQLQKEAFELSKTDRRLSDQKYAEAQEILVKMDAFR